MVNLLITAINEVNYKFMETAIADINVNSVYMIVANRELEKYFQKYGTCFCLEDIVHGLYVGEKIDDTMCIPVEDTVFEYMNPHLLEILNQQRRYEQHHEYAISNTWENHYETYMRNISFFYNLLVKKSVTHIFFARLPHQGYDSIIYHLGHMMSLQITMSFASLIPHRDFAMSDYDKADAMMKEEFERLKDKYQDIEIDDIKLEGETKEAFEKWSSLDPVQMKPFYMQGNKLKKTFHARFGTTSAISEWKMILGNEYSKYGMGERFVIRAVRDIPKLFKATIKTYKRWRYARPCWKATKKMNDFYNEHAIMPEKDEQYIYFALHYQPEATSNPLGKGAYCDQRIPLQILSYSIPEHMKIYVKAHPDQLAFFSGVSYYKDILRIPNVRLIKMECSTYDLMKNAFAVASLTGTACWESQFYGVPAILFGKSYKNVSPLAYPVRTIEQCRQTIKDIEQGVKTTSLKELKLYTKAAHNLSYSKADISVVFPKLIKELIAR